MTIESSDTYLRPAHASCQDPGNQAANPAALTHVLANCRRAPDRGDREAGEGLDPDALQPLRVQSGSTGRLVRGRDAPRRIACGIRARVEREAWRASHANDARSHTRVLAARVAHDRVCAAR